MEKTNEEKQAVGATERAEGERAYERKLSDKMKRMDRRMPTDAAVLDQAIESLEVGPIRNYMNMTVASLIGVAEERGPEYLTMTEALAGDFLEVTEVDHGGSVPYLRVRNLSGENVLLVDGEELVGAKQNRVLNTTVLVEGQTEVVVPVSCTERGRWSYKSSKFADSKVMMAKRARSSKSKSVSHSLKMHHAYCSDQSEVWDDIEDMCEDYGCSSPTGAMKAVYEQRENELVGYREAFPPVEGQRGVVIFVNGVFSGCEIISRSRAYAQVHRKLIESYALDAFLERKASAELPSAEKAEALLAEISSWDTERFKSVGLGDDLRLRRRDSHGNALLVDDSIVHAAAFGPQS